MIPILFAPTDTTFETFGIGHLTDAISPHVVEERNGEFTFEMQYPIDGQHYDEIVMRSIILAKPNPQQQAQPFRVYRITKPINGVVTISANHLRYDLEGVPVAPFTANSLYNALNAMVSNRLVQSPFVFETDKWSNNQMSSTTPCSTLSLMGGQQGSLLDIYGGEYEFDTYTIRLLSRRGTDSGITIRYGVDLIDLQQEENCANCYTGVLCFWKSMDGDQIVSGTIQSTGTFDYTRIKIVDRSGNYEKAPTQEQLNADAVEYINTNRVGVPRVSLNVSFATLEQTEEYQNIRRTVSLCDYVTIEFEKLGVSATAKIIRTDYDVINERYISVEIGDSRTSLADTIIGISTLTENVPTTTEMAQAISATTAAITGANGGAVRTLDTNNDGLPDTLYIADNPNPLMAEKVWRFNYEGWGASENGYSGPFTMGATFAQGFIADFITAGTLSAERIAANSITVSKLTGTIENGDWVIDLEHGTLTLGKVSASEITAGELDASQITVKNLNADNITAGTLSVARIADNSLGGVKLQNSTITGGKIASSTIEGGNIKALTITGTNVANETLAGGKIASRTLTDTQIQAQGVSTASLSAGVVSSLGFADFSDDVFNNRKTASYCHATNMTVDSVMSVEDRLFASRLFVYLNGGAYEATWQQITIPTFTTKYLKVYDGNDQYIGYTERFAVPTGTSDVWVLKH